MPARQHAKTSRLDNVSTPARRHVPTWCGAAATFLGTGALYTATVAPTATLWDSGEFIASAFGLQVMHPPGAPLYILLGRLFSAAAAPEYVALAVNVVSVLSGALTALFTYLILVRIIRRAFADAPATSVIGGAVIGALTLAVSDSFWFNAVESEVYALAMLFTAAIVWLTLRWSDELRLAGSVTAGWHGHRYLVLAALLFGLAIGIHLMAVLTYFFIVPVAHFALIDRPARSRAQRLKAFALTAALATIGFAAIYPGLVISLPQLAAAVGSPLLLAGLLGAALTVGLLFTHRRRVALAHLALLCAAALLVGYSSYSIIPIRSAANPFIDLNDPETTEAFVSYVKREQYGHTPLIKGTTFDQRTGTVDRSTLFPRRHSSLPQHIQLYSGYDSDWDYFRRYQMGHMYARYFLWNFAGRAHDVQHAGATAGFSNADAYHYDTSSERASRNTYFALPLLLGLLGLIVHFRADPRRAFSLLALFLVMGTGLVVYLNEIPVTPRERDYIYVGSYFVFCLWNGLGAAALIRAAACIRFRRAAPVGAAFLLALAVPGWMGLQNFDDHDRSGNYVARDFAYNLLMSVEQNAVLFTGGDNDTYPLWYLQFVEGVRRDVRVVCLPLLQTDWYARQLRNQWALDAPPLPISLSDDQIDALRPVSWQPRDVALPVDLAALRAQPEMEIAVEDTNGFESPMGWHLEGRSFREDVRYLHTADQVILDVLATNARAGWTRPIYFASTAGASDRLDLDPYLQREGLALRVVPIRHEDPRGRVVPRIMTSRLEHFRFTNLDDERVYFADDARSLAGFNYRLTYAHAADTLVDDGRPAEARRLLDRVMDAVPPDTIPLHPYQAITLGRTYLRLNDTFRVVDLLAYAEPRLLRDLRSAAATGDLQTSLQYAQMMRSMLIRAEAFDEASGFSHRLADILGDDALRQSPDELRRFYELSAPREG